MRSRGAEKGVYGGSIAVKHRATQLFSSLTFGGTTSDKLRYVSFDLPMTASEEVNYESMKQNYLKCSDVVT